MRQNSMSSRQRHDYLARRRSNYHVQQIQRSNIMLFGGDIDQVQHPNIVQFDEGNSNHVERLNIVPFGEGSSNQVPRTMRLTHIRQIARSNRTRLPQDGLIQSFTHNENTTAQSFHSNIPMNHSYPPIINEAYDFNLINENDIQPNEDVPPRQHPMGTRPIHNCARNFNENMGIPRFHMPNPTTCPDYHARLFSHETFEMCYLRGKLALPLTPSLLEMIELFCNQSAQGRHFRQNIRAYNHIFAFTSMGVHVDENLVTGRRGIYTFRAQGSIYHKIGSLLPIGDSRPRFLQMYIYDTAHEIDNRMRESEALNRDVVEKIQQILNQYNPFVQTIHHLAQHQDLQSCRLIIKEQPANQRQYCLPYASQVAAIIVGGEGSENIRGRDIVVQTTDGQLKSIKDCVGYYDPLQYPLLLPYGTYG
ncbi:hypothetical protein ACFX1S_015083 [Malus domestica]